MRITAVEWVVVAALPFAAFGADDDGPSLGAPVETDAESGAQVYLLGADARPADNIYGEQPYSDPTGRWVAVRYYGQGDSSGGISILDLVDGSRRDVLVGKPPFPAFHAWGDYLYYHQKIDGRLTLRRCRYDAGDVEDIAVLPEEMGQFSYGTVSPDHRYYAVSVQPGTGGPSNVHLLDLKTGQWRLLLQKPGYHAKHEQFSRDGRNRVLIQLNQMPDIKKVLLGELGVNGEEALFAADRPHTPRPTGHEAWIGDTSSIFFSTAVDPDSVGNLWQTKLGDAGPTLVDAKGKRCGHVSVSRCGRYWVGDSNEEGVPIYIGGLATGSCRRAVFSRTVYDGKQWSHAHPYLTADNKWLIFAANREGHPQVYGARLDDAWLNGLL